MLRQYSVDAVIVASSTLPPGFSRGFRDAGLPVVHAFGRPTGSPEVHMAGIDNVACGRMAAQTLLRRGYRNVAFLGGPEAATTTQDRLAGFMEEVSLCSGATARVSFANAYSYAAGETEMQRILANGSTSEAYFCGDDVIAIGALSAVRAAGRRVPEDAGIIGLNDMEMAAWSLINLTTIRQPIAEIITASVDLAVAASENPQRPPVEQLFQCEVVERGTLRPRTGA
jgi:DNA-binding LacI/PurR family transcriptional regulator